MRMTIASAILIGFCGACPSAGAQNFDRSTCPPELSNYGGCPVRVYVAPARPAGFHEQAYGVVRKGYDPDPGTLPPVKPKRTTGASTR